MAARAGRRRIGREKRSLMCSGSRLNGPGGLGSCSQTSTPMGKHLVWALLVLTVGVVGFTTHHLLVRPLGRAFDFFPIWCVAHFRGLPGITNPATEALSCVVGRLGLLGFRWLP